MKKLFLFLIILFLVKGVYALDCQYTETEPYQEIVKNYYLDNIFVGRDIIIDEVLYFELQGYRITVYNKLPVNVLVDVSYVRKSNWYGRNELIEQWVSINPEDKFIISDTWLSSFSSRYDAHLTDVKIKYGNGSRMISKLEAENKERLICKTCNGKLCLDDGKICKQDNECGSEICNIAGFCGREEIVTCNDWLSGSQNCNNQCLFPKSKSVGEPYICVWECFSGAGDNNICEHNNRSNLLFITLITLIFGVGSYFGIKSLNKKRWKRLTDKIINKAEKEATAKLDKARKEAETIVKDANKQLVNISKELEKSRIVKETILQELKNLSNSSKEKEQLKTKIEKINQDIKRLIDEQKEMTKEHKEELERLTSIRLTPFINKQGRRVIINSNGYEVFPGTSKLFHRWWFEFNKERKIKEGHEIHHKDFNKRNNDISNLQEVSFSEHKKIHRNKFKKK